MNIETKELLPPVQSDSRKSSHMNILVTLDANYIPYLNVMLTSMLYSNPDTAFTVYFLHTSVKEEELASTRAILHSPNRLIPVHAKNLELEDAPTTARYPQEIYYRIFAARYLPEDVDRILYLDPDIIVNGSLKELYEMPMQDSFFAAASHIKKLMHKVNELRLDMDEDSPYINSGVMLMNLRRLRLEQNIQEVFLYIEKYKNKLILPDQDIISALYGSKIISLDPYRYNMTERLFALNPRNDAWFDLDWVRKNATIIHYCGRNKPWKNGYIGQLDLFFKETLDRMQALDNPIYDDPCAASPLN